MRDELLIVVGAMVAIVCIFTIVGLISGYFIERSGRKTDVE